MLSYPYRKGTSFSQLTLYRYAATMLLYHGLHIEQSQPIAFHIVQITRGYAVEFVEDVLLLLGSNTDTVVADGDFGLFILPFDGHLAAMDGHFGFSVRIFDGVVYQVADDVAEMRTVGKYAQIFRFDVHRYVDGAFRFQLVLFDERFQNITYCKLLRVQAESPAAFHTHGKYLFNQSTEALKLFLADTQVFVALGLFLRLVEVEQSVVGGICYGDGGFQFVGDVVGEIALHLFQCLLFQDGAYQEPEGESEYDQNNE